MGGSVIAAVHALRGKPEDRDLVRRLAPALPVTFAITQGVAPLLFVQLTYGPFFYAASVLMGVPWLGLIFLLMLALMEYRAQGAADLELQAWLRGRAKGLLWAKWPRWWCWCSPTNA